MVLFICVHSVGQRENETVQYSNEKAEGKTSLHLTQTVYVKRRSFNGPTSRLSWFLVSVCFDAVNKGEKTKTCRLWTHQWKDANPTKNSTAWVNPDGISDQRTLNEGQFNAKNELGPLL